MTSDAQPTGADAQPAVTFRAATLDDGAAMWRIARDSQVLDVNTSYAYLLMARDFGAHSAVAEMGGEVPQTRDALEALPGVGRKTANVVLGNGARLYVDHAHPEYSSPEVTGPLAVGEFQATVTTWNRLAHWQPLANLAIEPETEFYLGLLHAEDGAAGARYRAALAAKSAACS
mgnify:CR=1 FL=1